MTPEDGDEAALGEFSSPPSEEMDAPLIPSGWGLPARFYSRFIQRRDYRYETKPITKPMLGVVGWDARLVPQGIDLALAEIWASHVGLFGSDMLEFLERVNRIDTEYLEREYRNLKAKGQTV